MLVFDLPISRQILTSKAFNGANYFRPGMERLNASGTPLEWLENFYDETVLFKEGEEHHALKAAFNRILTQACSDLEASRSRILKHFQKRRKSISSPLDFSEQLVRLCFGLVITRLTSIDMRTIYRSLSLRRNVFFSHFHPHRQTATNDALANFYKSTPPPEKGEPGWHEHLLAQSLLIMGIDPMIGTICASIVDGHADELAAGVFRYCPTAFVYRICIQPVSIGNVEFTPGDVCYVSLLPATDEKEKSCPEEETRNSSLAFGIGVHTCIGKHLSLSVLSIAQEVLQQEFSQGFGKVSVLAPEGTFLAFHD